MIVFNEENAPICAKLQKVEDLLRELKLTISWQYGMVVRDLENEMEGTIKDVESRDVTDTLPRVFESERIVKEN